MPTRRSRDELRELVLEAGVELLGESSVAMTIDAISYKSVFARLIETKGVRVTHASVHERIWPSQRDFQLAVLAAAIERMSVEGFGNFEEAARDAVVGLPLATPAERRFAVQEVARQSVNDNWQDPPANHRVLQVLRYLCATLDADDASAEPLRNVVRDARERTTALYAEAVHQIVAALGLRVRSDLGLSLDEAVEAIARGANAATAGFDLDNAVAKSAPLEMATGPNGESEMWHQSSIVAWSLTRSLLELDGDLPEEERSL